MANEPTIEEKNREMFDFLELKHSEHKDIDEWEMKTLKYHEDWNQLMSVWGRFRTVVSDHFDEDYPAEYCSMCDVWALHCEHVNIHGAHKLLYDAIIWLNQQKQKDGAE